MPVKCCNRVPALRRFHEATGRIAKFGWGAALQVAESAVERGEAAQSGIHRDGQDRDVTLCRIGQRVGRLANAHAIEIGVEVAGPQPLVDGTAQPVFGHAKSCRHCCDGQSILSIEPLVPHVGLELGQQKRIVAVMARQIIHGANRGSNQRRVPPAGREHRDSDREQQPARAVGDPPVDGRGPVRCP